jgi:hypothetical protein
MSKNNEDLLPKTGEHKQGYLRRCTKSLMTDGWDATRAYPKCEKAWTEAHPKQTKMSHLEMMEYLHMGKKIDANIDYKAAFMRLRDRNRELDFADCIRKFMNEGHGVEKAVRLAEKKYPKEFQAYIKTIYNQAR